MIVFAPHPDDETFGCGGTIAKRLQEGYEATIVVMTDGRNAFSELFNSKSPLPQKEVRQIRRVELVKATEILGVPKKNIIFLDFEDGKLSANIEDATVRAFEVLDKLRPVEVYFPHHKDAHPDHRATNSILKECFRKLNFSTHSYNYSISGKSARLAFSITKLLNRFTQKIVFVDISSFLQQKAEAMKAYKSQVGIIYSGQDRPVVPNYQRFLKKFEIFSRYEK